ncbi:hypothetical protein [Ureibacillus manganicus]|uniref:Uncharacterized protein n=1 Tax=Ureibacillus manganicus DSM 26584 TaxID=1384049 RepID=A0A0A3I338_9BACL|nr:hypothetical protein [Ureibacillus manganicus]KGR79226.1 hypothetical protein CD29_07740 [Ureibacillus manganicus DSM 26584]
MTYQVKKNIMQLVSAIFVFGIYFWYVYQQYLERNVEGVELFRFWATAILILIPVTIVLRLIIEIIFIIINGIITKESAPSFSDEFDKIIDLKAMRVSHFIFILGFFVAMGSLLFDSTPSTMFIILLFSGFLSEAFSIVWKIFLYQRGV